MSNWTNHKARVLLEQVPAEVRAVEPKFWAWAWDELHGMEVGPHRLGPRTMGPVIAAKLSAHGVQVEV